MAAEDFQMTSTDKLLGKSWVCRGGVKLRPLRRQHYRMIVDTVGYGLKYIRGTEELLHATYNVFTGM